MERDAGHLRSGEPRDRPIQMLERLLGSNRVSPEVELAGLDIPEMGAPGYPEFITHVAPETLGFPPSGLR